MPNYDHCGKAQLLEPEIIMIIKHKADTDLFEGVSAFGCLNGIFQNMTKHKAKVGSYKKLIVN